MTKWAQKLLKNIVQKLRCFLYIFRICSLKIFVGSGLGGHAPSSPLPGYAPAYIKPAVTLLLL